MTGSNHCFKSSSDSNRRGENRRTDAANESTVDIVGTPLDTGRRARRRPILSEHERHALALLGKREAVGAAGVGFVEPDRLGVVFEIPRARLLARLQQRL